MSDWWASCVGRRSTALLDMLVLAHHNRGSEPLTREQLAPLFAVEPSSVDQHISRLRAADVVEAIAARPGRQGWVFRRIGPPN